MESPPRGFLFFVGLEAHFCLAGAASASGGEAIVTGTLRERLIAKLTESGSIPLDFYPDLAKTDDPSSGFALTVYSPRFSTGYFPQRNRFTVLVETHSWKAYALRVRTTVNTIVALVELVGAHGDEWLKLCKVADATAGRLGGTDVTLDYVTRWREPGKAGAAISERDDAHTSRVGTATSTCCAGGAS